VRGTDVETAIDLGLLGEAESFEVGSVGFATAGFVAWPLGSAFGEVAEGEPGEDEEGMDVVGIYVSSHSIF
jgi:hypothetical protein